MLFNVGVQHGRDHLLVIVSGPATLADLLGAAQMVASVAAGTGQRRALVDLLGAQPQLSADDHRRLGAGVAEAWRALDRVAAVVPSPERIGLSEQAARANGLELRTFTALQPAADWLAQA